MIDFDALVLGPAMDAFARPITVFPDYSQPGQPSYEARGIWARRPQDMPLDDGSFLGTDELTVGIRIGEFPIVPVAGDRIEIPAAGSLTRIGMCEMIDDGEDGQGGYALVVKIIGP